MEQMSRKLPIGIQSFESLRTDGYLYVDKTRYIHKLVHSGKQYFLSRPRRFGKSLFLSSLRSYWEGKKALFAGLDIMELENKRAEAWQTHPVFYFDFTGKNYQQATALEDLLDGQLREWEQRYGGDGSRPLEERFRMLLARAAQSGKRCVVLVDEYDKPLLEVMQNAELEEHNKAVFKGFFSVLKSCDEYLQFVLITGVTKFSKVSIFSDLNQLNDISFSSEYSGICGITEEELRAVFTPEVEAMAEHLEITPEACFDALNRTYDGYHFHPKGEGVYNPFSLLKALFDQELNSYWFATGTPTFLARRIQETRFDVQRFTNGTLYASEAALSDYRVDNPDILPLLYQTGYLTICGYDARRKRYTLGFPNEEVKYGFLENLLPEYTPETSMGTGKDIFSLDDCVENGDTDGMKDILTALFASIPYTAKETPFEHYFQTVIYLVFTLLGKFVQCELHTSQGRIDCVLETGRYVYLFEFKLDQTAGEALTQIEKKEYALPYAAERKTLYQIGVNFDSRVRNITEWKVRE
jgi:hypothetical protein